MQVPILPIVIARRRFKRELTIKKLLEYSRLTKLTTRTIGNVLNGATEARDDTEIGFFNMLDALSKEGKVPSYDRSLMQIELFRRKRHSSFRDDLRKGKCDLDKLRDFIIQTGCPSLDPHRQTTWAATGAASYARFYNADLIYHGVKAFPNRIGGGKVWLGNDGSCRVTSARSHRESLAGFGQAAASVASASDFDQHRDYFECATLLFKSMRFINTVNLVGLAIEAEDENWRIDPTDKMGIPTVGEAAQLLHDIVESRRDCVVLANNLCLCFEGAAWKARIRYNQACTLIAMISVPGLAEHERAAIQKEIVGVLPKLELNDRVELAQLSTTRRALRLDVLPEIRSALKNSERE